MIIFKTVKFKNFLSTGNYFIEVNLQSHPITIITGKNGHGKCFFIDTPIRIQNKKTGEIIETTIGEFYEKQNQTDRGKDK
jgi:ABC-type cobalamin/Fe3+-siderophores transport system ATPase subunit